MSTDRSGSTGRPGAAVYAYRIPLLEPLVLPGIVLRERRGLVLRLTDSEGREGLGEAAPLPGFSMESLPECRDALIRLSQRWLNQQDVREQGSSGKGLYLSDKTQNKTGRALDSLSARFAFDCAGLELDRGPLAATMPPDPYPLLSGDPDSLLRRWQRWPSPRPATIKLKVGRGPAAEEAQLIRGLLCVTPELRLRLDANRGWSRTQAEALIGALPSRAIRAIEYLEEPCRTLADSLAFTAQHRLPLALDESLREPGFLLPSDPDLCALILKPSLTGSLTKLQALIGEARQRGLRTVLSSSYESSLGTGQITALAQELTPDEPPGLDTQHLFGADLLCRHTDSPSDHHKPVLTLSDLECLWQA